MFELALADENGNRKLPGPFPLPSILLHSGDKAFVNHNATYDVQPWLIVLLHELGGLCASVVTV